VQPVTVLLPEEPAQIDYLRLSLDWNAQASGMLYYDANNPAGVTIDGVTDAVTTSPHSRWNQITSITGTVVNVSQVPSGLGGTQSTYYKDDDGIDSKDTGDQRSYGDAGFQVQDPNPGTHTVTGYSYFLTGTTSNVGELFTAYFDNPLQVSVEVYIPPPPVWYINLPFVVKPPPKRQIHLPFVVRD
jgi:hypothetical protein